MPSNSHKLCWVMLELKENGRAKDHECRVITQQSVEMQLAYTLRMLLVYYVHVRIYCVCLIVSA